MLVHWAPSEVLLEVPAVWLRAEGRAPESWRVESARRAGRMVLLRLQGIDDRDAADALRGAAVEVARDELPPLEPGEYYLCDLVGCRVVGPAGPVGLVHEVRPYPSVDVLVIQTSDGRLVEQPLTAPWIERVDVAGSCVALSSTDGIIE